MAQGAIPNYLLRLSRLSALPAMWQSFGGHMDGRQGVLVLKSHGLEDNCIWNTMLCSIYTRNSPPKNNTYKGYLPSLHKNFEWSHVFITQWGKREWKKWMFLISWCTGYTSATMAKSIRIQEAVGKIIDTMLHEIK